MAEDLAQEGWIALWQASKSWDPTRGPLNYWLKFKANGRMVDVLRNWSNNDIHDFVDTVPDLLHAADLGSIELAYHDGEIMEAINSLAPREREYIVRRFWQGMAYSELVSHFGYQPQALQRRSFAKLAKELAHLGAK